MRKEIIERELFTYDELSGEAQDKALEKLWDINVYCEWYEYIIEDIHEFGKVSGLDCRYGKEFDLERGSYLSITDIETYFSDLYSNQEKIKAAYPDIYSEVIKSFFDSFTQKEIKQILRLEKMGILATMSGETSRDRRGIRYDIDTTYIPESYKRITSLIMEVEDTWEGFIGDLEHYYLKRLRNEYEYLTSREAIEETIRCNEYEFTEDGQLA